VPGAGAASFDPADLQRIRAVNPIWWAWEQRLYADPAA
jgi:hypothetical protein